MLVLSPQIIATRINIGRVLEKARIAIEMMEVIRQGRIIFSLLYRSNILPPKTRPKISIMAIVEKKSLGLATP